MTVHSKATAVFMAMALSGPALAISEQAIQLQDQANQIQELKSDAAQRDLQAGFDRNNAEFNAATAGRRGDDVDYTALQLIDTRRDVEKLRARVNDIEARQNQPAPPEPPESPPIWTTVLVSLGVCITYSIATLIGSRLLRRR